ncbi:MAG: hypothetical protein L3J89_02205 [Gammaproteobacteria bacterium]|nr:hypothetical protein [Gammaproteobacteria bacterium]
MSIEKRLLVRLSIQIHGDSINALSDEFYRTLFQRNPELREIMPDDAVALNKKFFNMLAVFKGVKHLEKIESSIKQLGKRHFLKYGAKMDHFDDIRTALLLSLETVLASKFDDRLRDAWEIVFDEVASIMSGGLPDEGLSEKSIPITSITSSDNGLLAEIGGRDVVYAIHQRLYDVLFDEPWLERFFYGKEKSVLVRKQTEFMVAAFGGENHYQGDTPAFVHMHMMITEEQLSIRETALYNAMKDEGMSDDLIVRWLQVDRSFWPGLIKQSVNECVLKCTGQRAIVIEKPLGYHAPKKR